MLPDPLGLLSKTVPSTAIASANVEVLYMFEAEQATLHMKEAYAQGSSLRKNRGKEASSTASRAWRGQDCPGVLPKSGLGTSGLGSTCEWA